MFILSWLLILRLFQRQAGGRRLALSHQVKSIHGGNLLLHVPVPVVEINLHALVSDNTHLPTISLCLQPWIFKDAMMIRPSVVCVQCDGVALGALVPFNSEKLDSTLLHAIM